MTPGHRDLAAVDAWLTDVIAAAPDGVLPLLGSAEWLAADEATKHASVAAAALVSLYESDPLVIAVRVAAEIAVGNRRMKAAAEDVRSGVRWSTERGRWLPKKEAA